MINRSTVTADDPQEVFRRELAAVLSMMGFATQWLFDADDDTLWEVRREIKRQETKDAIL